MENNENLENETKEHSLITQIMELIKKCEQLEDENTTLKFSLQKLQVRERLYLSSLQKTKNDLLKMSASIETTPHVRAEEYQQFYESSNVSNNNQQSNS